jgi:predicted transcriptional regulator
MSMIETPQDFPRSGDVLFTERELDVMGVLWELGSGTVADVKDRLADPLAYTTVLTVLRTLEDKGYVGHEEEGRAYRYYPLVERDQAQESALRRLVQKLFSGSTELLLTHLVADRAMSERELKRLRQLLEDRLES